MISNILKGLRRRMLLIIISTTYMFLFSSGPTIKHTCMYARDIPVSIVVIKSNTTRILSAQTQLLLFEITILDVTF